MEKLFVHRVRGEKNFSPLFIDRGITLAELRISPEEKLSKENRKRKEKNTNLRRKEKERIHQTPTLLLTG